MDITFATSSELVRVPSDTLVYVSADGNYSMLMLADGERCVLTMQLGQVEQHIARSVSRDENRFIRIGRSLIINRDYIMLVNPSKQRLVLSDCRTFRQECVASRDALNALKDIMEKE